MKIKIVEIIHIYLGVENVIDEVITPQAGGKVGLGTMSRHLCISAIPKQEDRRFGKCSS